MEGIHGLHSPKGKLMRTICADCGMPQPDEDSLHLEHCPAHNSKFCIVCLKESLEVK